jgi:hypothetical protein
MRILIAAAAVLAASAAAPAFAQHYAGNGYGGGVVRCESNDGRTRECPTGGGRVMLQKQLSNAPCIEGRTWGTGRNGVWVSQGCRADFRVAGNGWGGGNGGDIVNCNSNDGRLNRCAINGRGGRVQLVRQMSNAPCIEGRTWGSDRNSIWVSQGCRGQFSVGRGGGWDESGYGGRVFRCESIDGRTRECPANTRAGVQLVRVLSDAPCVQGRTWGYGRNGIWVAQGCRAEFRAY